MEKSYSLNINDVTRIDKLQRRISMDLGAFFTALEYMLMGCAFIALVLIFLYAYYGEDEEQTNQ